MDSLQESAFVRAQRDFHNLATNTVRFAIWAAFCALVATACATFFTWGHKQGTQTLIAVGAFAVGTALAFALPFAALWLTAPVRQRDEARTRLIAQEPFPNMIIDAPAIGRFDTADYPRLVLTMRITNREPTRVSLLLAVSVELASGGELRLPSDDVIERMRAVYSRASLPTGPTIMPAPLPIEPHTSADLNYGFSWFDHEAQRFSPPPSGDMQDASPLNDEDRLRLDVTDLISGQTAALYIPGHLETRGAAV